MFHGDGVSVWGDGNFWRRLEVTLVPQGDFTECPLKRAKMAGSVCCVFYLNLQNETERPACTPHLAQD